MRIIFVIIGSDSPLPKRERFTECLRKHFANVKILKKLTKRDNTNNSLKWCKSAHNC